MIWKNLENRKYIMKNIKRVQKKYPPLIGKIDRDKTLFFRKKYDKGFLFKYILDKTFFKKDIDRMIEIDQ